MCLLEMRKLTMSPISQLSLEPDTRITIMQYWNIKQGQKYDYNYSMGIGLQLHMSI
jgi:hypothetical protein